MTEGQEGGAAVLAPPAASIRDRMLVAYRECPDKVSGGDGMVLLGWEGEGLIWWMGEVSPNVGHWSYAGVPSLHPSYGISATPQPTVSSPRELTGLWVWEGWVEGHDDAERWEGTWRRATAADLAAFGLPLAG